MLEHHEQPESADRARGQFATTQWSVVLAAGQGTLDCRPALEALCRGYWFPVYSYLRRSGAGIEQAQDLTQGFFAQLLEKGAISRADPERGRFRSFLLTALKNYAINEHKKECAVKRAGDRPILSLDFEAGESRYQIEPSHSLTPEKLFERRWVLTMLDQVLEILQSELKREGKDAQFQQLKAALLGEMTQAEYESAAVVLGLTAAAAKQAAYRFRKRYRELFRQAVARTVADESETDVEIGRLLASLSET